MSGIATAIVGSAVVGGAASYLGGKKQADAANNAANMSEAQYQQMRTDQQPYVQSGYSAQNKLNELLGLNTSSSGGSAQPLSYDQWAAQQQGNQFRLGAGGFIGHQLMPPVSQSGYQNYLAGFNGQGAGAGSGSGNQPSDFGSLLSPFDANTFNQYKDPGYQFRLQQGDQALMNSAAANSGALSGAALKDLLGYNQDMASTEYGNAFNRYQTQQGNTFSRLSQIAQQGENAAANMGQQGTALTGQAAQATQNAGTAYGAGIAGIGNAAGSGTNNYLAASYLGMV